MIDNEIADNACVRGRQLVEQLKDQLAGNSKVVDIRHRGLLVGIELDRPCGELVTRALEAGLLINVTASKVIRLLPPLILDEEQTGQIATTLVACINQFLEQ